MRGIIDIISKNYKDFEIWQEQRLLKNIEISDEGKKEDIITSLNTAVRVFKEGKKGFVYISGNNKDDINVIYDNLKFALEGSFIDTANVLPIPDIKDGDSFGSKKGLCDSNSLLKKIEPIIELKKSHPKVEKIERATVTNEEIEISFYNSEKGFAHQIYQKYSLGLVLVVKDNNDEKIEWDYSISDNLDELDGSDIFNKAYNRALKLLNSSPINSGRYPVLMEGRCSCDFLEVLAKSFIAENLFKKKSLFDERKAFSPLLNIIDDPAAKKGSIKYFFDGEGFISTKKELMRDGEVKDFIYDFFYGTKLGRRSNGGSVRNKVILPPQNGCTNVYILPSKKDEIGLKIKELGLVVNIINLIGMHLVNPVTGEFSVGFEGYLTKNGEFVKSISQCTISGNIKDIFSNILAIGDDLQFYGNTGSPSILFAPICVSGL